MTGIDAVAAYRRADLLLMPLKIRHELLLLGPVRFPEETGHLVVAGADPMEQVPDTTIRVADLEGLFDPVPDLDGAVKPPGPDLVPQLLDLAGSQIPRIALVVQGGQCLQAPLAEQPDPLSDLAFGDSEP